MSLYLYPILFCYEISKLGQQLLNWVERKNYEKNYNKCNNNDNSKWNCSSKLYLKNCISHAKCPSLQKILRFLLDANYINAVKIHLSGPYAKSSSNLSPLSSPSFCTILKIPSWCVNQRFFPGDLRTTMIESRASGGVVIIDRYHIDIRWVVKALDRAHALPAVAYKIYKVWISFIPLSKWIHHSFKTQDTHHQKSKRLASVVPQKDWCPLIFLFKIESFYLGSDVSLHNPIWVETYELEYLHQEAGLWVHVEFDTWVTLKERNVWREAGQLLYRRMEESTAPELSDCHHLIIHKHRSVTWALTLPSQTVPYIVLLYPCFSFLLRPITFTILCDNRFYFSGKNFWYINLLQVHVVSVQSLPS